MGVGVDLLALSDGNLDSAKSGNLGSKESVDKMITQVALQNYLNEVGKYEQLMNPLSEIMNKSIAASSQPQSGLGSVVGPQLHEAALRGGIIPPPTPPRQPRPLTAEFQRIIDENKARGTVIGEKALVPVVNAVPDGALTARSVESTSMLSDISSIGFLNPGDGDFDPLAAAPTGGRRARKPISGVSRSVTEKISVASRSTGMGHSLDVEEPRSTHTEPTAARKRWDRMYSQEDASQGVVSQTAASKAKKSTKAASKRHTAIPWSLLDQLDGEKRKHESEVKFILETKKF